MHTQHGRYMTHVVRGVESPFYKDLLFPVSMMKTGSASSPDRDTVARLTRYLNAYFRDGELVHFDWPPVHTDDPYIHPGNREARVRYLKHAIWHDPITRKELNQTPSSLCMIDCDPLQPGAYIGTAPPPGYRHHARKDTALHNCYVDFTISV